MSTRSMRSLRRLVLTFLCAFVALGSCTALDEDVDDVPRAGSAACAATVVYQGHTYFGHGGLKRDPAITGRLVDGTIPPCDDTGGQEPVGDELEVLVAELAGVPLETAFLWNGTVFVREGRELPAATRTWFRTPRCTSAGMSDLTGDWLGVTGPKRPRFDGDLRPPYRLEVHVVDGPRKYVGATVRVHADTSTEPGLGPRDVKRSLWKSGQVVARVSCVDGRFHAHALRTPPR